MSTNKRDRRRRNLNKKRGFLVEALEGRALLTSITEFGVPTQVARLTGITTGPDGNLWFAEQNANQIGRITTGGTITEFGLPDNSNPNYITTGPDGALWFTNPGNNTIGRITTTGTVTEFTVPTNGSGPAGITTGPDGALWFAEQDGGKIGRITTTGSFTEYGAGFLNSPYEITVGPDGNLWFTEINADEIGKIVPSGPNAGSITLYDVAAGSSPRGITAGSDGKIWFTESGSNIIGNISTAGVITEYGVPTLNSYPSEITSGPGGDLFFSEGAANKIGRITTSGIISEYDVPTADAAPNGITLGPDNNIWFVEYIGNQVTTLVLGPQATDDSYTAIQNTTLTRNAAQGVLSNDTGTNTLTATLTSDAAHGHVSLGADGSFTYVPDLNYHGPDSFTYTVNDGIADSNIATVNITVDAPPVAQNDAYTAIQDTVLVRNAAQGALANDTDADGDPLSVAPFWTGTHTTTHGSITLNADGSFSYTPDDGYYGPDYYGYQATDGTTFSGIVGINITVDAPPVAVADSYTTDAGIGLPVTIALDGVLANDTDADGNPLTAIAVTQPAHGTLFLFASGLNADGTFTYYPNIGFTGTDSFTYKVNDGNADSNTVTVTITVNPLPVAVADSYTAIQDTPLVKGVLEGVVANDSGTGTLAASVVTNPAHGTVSLDADGSFTYTPDAGYAGTDSFTYKTHDGIADSNTATVNIRVDTPPTASPDSYLAPANTPLVVDAAHGVLINDGDLDGDQIVASSVSGPAHGTLDLHADGSFTYTPDAGYSGADSFTYQAGDGFASSSIVTVSLLVDALPLSGNDSYVTVANTGLAKLPAAGVLANDSDADGDPITAVLVTGPAHGSLVLNPNGSFTYNPAPGYHGPDSFTYTANDGKANGNTATVNIFVDAPPVTVADQYVTVENTGLAKLTAVGVLANDTDADGDTLSAILVSNTSHGTLILTASGSFTYNPAAGFFGTDSFTYKANDGTTDGNVTTVTIQVDAPPVAVDDHVTAVVNTPIPVGAASGVLANDTDAEGDTLSVILVSNPAHGTVMLDADGSFTYTPDLNFTGTDSFTYKANDGTTDGNTATVSVRVDAPPVAVSDAYNDAIQDTPFVVAATDGVLANDTDPESDSLTAVVVSNPAHGTLTLNADGSFTYTPDAGYYGPDSFSYKANDGMADGNTATVSIRVDAPPVGAADIFSVQQDTTLLVPNTAGVLANDTDAEGDALTAAVVSSPAHGFLSLNADGSFMYIPDAGYHGPDSFSYQAGDGVTTSSTVTVSIQVVAPPVVVDDSYVAVENTPLTKDAASGVLANDTDADGNPITAVVASNPSHGTVVLNPDGSFTYTPDAGFYGTDSFSYTATDGTYSSITQGVVTVVVDAPPLAVDDSYTTREQVPLTVGVAGGLLANDSDAEGDPITAVLVSGPSHGTLSLFADGSFTYTPDAQFYGTDSFSYLASDGTTLGNAATVHLTVLIDHAPAAADDSFSLAQGGGLTVAAPGLIGNDSDSDDDTITAVIASSPAHGVLSFNADGSFSYTPDANFIGTDSFTYRAFDGVLTSNLATVTLTVSGSNHAPVAANLSFTTPEETPLSKDAASGLATGQTDADGNTLTSSLVTAPSHGSVTINEDGSFTYTPDPLFFGTDSFTYAANDGSENSNTATVTITVTHVNHAPAASDDGFSVAEDQSLAISAPGLLGNDSDADGDPLTAILVSNPAHGTLALNADGSFTYTPNPLYSGPDSFSYKLNDGAANSNTATVSLIVTHVNHAPVAGVESYTTSPDTPLALDSPGVLANDTDIDGEPLAAVLVSSPSHGSLTLNADGSFLYTPDAGYSGPDSFSYAANDGTENSLPTVVNITVTASLAPIAADDAQIVGEGGITVSSPGILANDSDPSGSPLTALLVSGTSHGQLIFRTDGSYTYIPDATFDGTDSFTYRAFNGTANSNVATVTLTFDGHYFPAVAQPDFYSVNQGSTLSGLSAGGVLTNDQEFRNYPLTASLVSAPSHGSLTLNADGSFTYTPDAQFFGTDSFRYKANNGHVDSSPATVTITVNHVNHAPVAADDSFTTPESSPLTVLAPGFLGNDSDADGDPISAVLVAGPTHGTLSLHADGSFTYTPNPLFVGTDSFTYKTDDGLATSNIATVNLTVTHVNHAPVAADDSFVTAENVPLSISAPGLLGNDSDVDHDALAAVLVAGPSHGTLTLNVNGSFAYTPAANFNGSDSFTYRPSDGSLAGNLATVHLTVTPVNQTPVVTALPVTAMQGSPLNGAVVATFTDADAGEYAGSYAASIDWGDGSAPTAGTVASVGGTFQVTGSHVYAQAATFAIKVTVTDPAGGIGAGTATATVSAIPAQFQLTGAIVSPGMTATPSGTSVTNNNQPSVSGVAAPGYLVTLLATKDGVAALIFSETGAPQILGQAIAGPDGSYRITSAALPEGTFALSLTAVNLNAPGSNFAQTMSLGRVVVDTTPPTVSGITFSPQTRQFLVTFRDAEGMNLATILDPSSYSVFKPVKGRSRINVDSVTGVTLVSSSGDTTTVAVTVGARSWLQRGKLIFEAFGRPVADTAGNHLAGTAVSSLPSGGTAGGDFLAGFQVPKHHGARSIKPSFFPTGRQIKFFQPTR